MADRFRRSDVILHSIDTRGIRTNVDASEGLQRTSNDSLYMLAGATGGSAFANSNDLGSNFDRLMRREEVVYVLAFHAPASEAGKFHNLSVKLSGVQGGRVVHRTGYEEAGGEDAVERVLTVAEVMVNDVPQNDLRVAALVTPFADQVPVVLEVDGSDLIAASSRGTADAEIFVYAFDEDGVVRDSLAQQLSIELAKAGSRLRAGGLKYYGTLALPPGRYAVRSLVRVGETKKMGFVRTDVLVPAASDLAVSQPHFIDDAKSGLLVRGKSHAPEAPYPFEIHGEPFIPALRPAQGSRRFAVFVANFPAGGLAFEFQPEATLLSRETVPGAARLVFELKAVQPEPEWLNVTVRKPGADVVRTASVPLTADP